MPNFNWFPGHMNKALKNISDKLPAIDLILEIVDSRAPQASSNPALHRILGSKPILKLLSKADWADPKVTQQWLAWYQKANINASLLNYKDPHFSQNLIQAINKTLTPKLLKWKNKGLLKPQINVLVVGIPNVGKSTFINQLLKRHKTIVSNRPGVTRGLQIIQLSPSINIIDSPGVLPPKLNNWEIATNLVAINSVKKGVYPIVEVGNTLAEKLYQKYPNYWIKKYQLKPKLETENIAKNIFESIAREKKYLINSGFNWELQIIQPFIEDLANGKFHFSFEFPDEN